MPFTQRERKSNVYRTLSTWEDHRGPPLRRGRRWHGNWKERRPYTCLLTFKQLGCRQKMMMLSCASSRRISCRGAVLKLYVCVIRFCLMTLLGPLHMFLCLRDRLAWWEYMFNTKCSYPITIRQSTTTKMLFWSLKSQWDIEAWLNIVVSQRA